MFRCRYRLGSLAAIVFLAVFGSTAQADVTGDFVARFEVHRGALALGTTSFSLKSDPAHDDCYIYTGRADPNALVSLFVGKIRDESRFCMENGVVRPRHFSHRIAGDQGKSYTLDFDWSARRVTYRSQAGKQSTMTLPKRAADPLSIHIVARQWADNVADPDALGEADFAMVDENEIKSYRLRAVDGGPVETPGGRFDTLRVDRVHKNKRLTFWLARGAGWIPVRVEQQKGDGAIIRMNLDSLAR